MEILAISQPVSEDDPEIGTKSNLNEDQAEDRASSKEEKCVSKTHQKRMDRAKFAAKGGPQRSKARLETETPLGDSPEL
jgi:hypothetical protein